MVKRRERVQRHLSSMAEYMKKETQKIIAEALKLRGGRSRPDKSLKYVFSKLSMFENKSIFDVGCGRCITGACIKAQFPNAGFTITGIEAYKEYLKDNKYKTTYDDIIIGDYLKKYTDYMDYDIFLFFDVLEHFPPDKAEEIILVLSEANKIIFLTIPTALKHWQQCKAFEKNVFEKHLHNWTVKEVEVKLGLKLLGECEAIGTFCNV